MENTTQSVESFLSDKNLYRSGEIIMIDGDDLHDLFVAYASACSASSTLEDEIQTESDKANGYHRNDLITSGKHMAFDDGFFAGAKWAISRLSLGKIVLPELKPMPRLNDSEYVERKAWNDCIESIKLLNIIK